MLKAISIYQIAGGVLGIIFSTSVIIKEWNNISILSIGLLPVCFFVYSVWCGVMLLKGRKRSNIYSMVNFLLQIIHISATDLTFEYVSGLAISVGISHNHTSSMDFGLSFSVFKFIMNHESGTQLVRVNLLALFLLVKVKTIRAKNPLTPS